MVKASPGSTRIRDLLIILDSVRYDRFMEAASNLKRGEVYRAYAHGTWTRPSVSSMLSGYLPQSEAGQPYVPSWVMLSPFMFHNREVPAWFLNANAWMHDMGPRRYEEVWYPDPYSAPKIGEDALGLMEGHNEYFIVMLLTETHGPYKYEADEDVASISMLWKAYNKGEDNDAPRIAAERSRKAIEYLDKLLDPLLNLPDRLIVTSDHGDLHGENHLIGHDPSFKFHIKLLEVPLVIRKTEV